jgi:hypothetical protein
VNEPDWKPRNGSPPALEGDPNELRTALSRVERGREFRLGCEEPDAS